MPLPAVWQVSSSSFLTNSAPSGGGGGVSLVSGDVALRDSLLSGNMARWGGALYLQGNASRAQVASCTISDNLATESGGGIATDDGANLILSNQSLLSGNAAPVGAALSHWGDVLAYVLPAPLGRWVASTIPCRIYRVPCPPVDSACDPELQPELETQPW